MLKTTLRLLLGAVLFGASQACAPAAPSILDPHAIDTAVAGTFEASLTQTAGPAIPITGRESPTPTIAPSLTPLPTFTTVVLGPARVSVSVATNCRLGPGEAYGRVGALLAGESAEVVGRSADGDYWIIRNPDRPGETCWLWGEFATLTGNPSGLPRMTPPPTPTPTRTPTRTPRPTSTRTFTPTRTPTPSPTLAPAFTAAFSALDSCADSGEWWVDIQLQNTGEITFESIALVVEDLSTGTVFSLYSDDFIDQTGCSQRDLLPNLPPGAVYPVSSSTVIEELDDDELRATISLCSNPGQSGTCTTQTIDFIP